MSAKLNGLGGFDAACIGEALDIADKLGEVAAAPPAKTENAKNAKLLRDQLAHLLNQRVLTVRAAARFVFRKHPDIAKLPASAYERRRRAESRRAKANAESAQ
jgi:hypothetical protein